MSVWVRASLLPHIKGVQATDVATGFGGYLGNKGERCLRFGTALPGGGGGVLATLLLVPYLKWKASGGGVFWF